MLGKRLNLKVCRVMHRKSCTHHGEAGQLPNPSFQWSKRWPVVAYLRRRHHNTHLFLAGVTTFLMIRERTSFTNIATGSRNILTTCGNRKSTCRLLAGLNTAEKTLLLNCNVCSELRGLSIGSSRRGRCGHQLSLSYLPSGDREAPIACCIN